MALLVHLKSTRVFAYGNIPPELRNFYRSKGEITHTAVDVDVLKVGYTTNNKNYVDGFPLSNIDYYTLIED